MYSLVLTRYIALEAGSGILCEHDGQPGRGSCPSCSPGWGLSSPDPFTNGTESPLWAFTKYRALNRLALRTKLNATSSMGGAIAYLKWDSMGPRGDAAIMVFNPAGAQTVTIDLRSLPTAVMGARLYDLFVGNESTLLQQQELQPPLARTWTVQMAAGQFAAFSGFSLGVFAPRKGKKSSCRADDGYSKPAIGDTLQACFLECANDKRCNNVFVEYMNINYMEKPPPANCTLLGPLQDPSTGCKGVTNASLGPGGTLIAALPGARSRATDWPGAMPPLVAGVEGYALKTDDHLDAQEVALSGPAWSGPSASLVRDASGQMRIVVDGQILSPSSRYHTGAKLETMVRAGANEIC